MTRKDADATDCQIRAKDARAKQPRDSHRVQDFRRKLASARLIASCDLRPTGLFLRNHSYRISALALALTLCAITLGLRVIDAQTAPVSEFQLQHMSLGAFATAEAKAALNPIPGPRWVGDVNSLPETSWNLTVSPGKVTKGTISTVLLTQDELWSYSTGKPVTIFVSLPPGGKFLSSAKMRAGDDEACASWSSPDGVHYARPKFYAGYDHNQIASCTLNPVQAFSSLFIEMHFEWPDQTFKSEGFGRSAGALRLDPFPDLPTNIPDAEALTTTLSTLTLKTASGTELVDSYPSPSGGGVNLRSWTISQTTDFVYHLESKHQRSWVVPVTELTLLSAGVFFGLVPSLPIRKRK